MVSVGKDKSDLRKSLLAKRGSLTLTQMQEKSAAVQKIFFGMDEFASARHIMFFVSFRSEVMTFLMIKEALNLNKDVIIPSVIKHSKKLKLSHIEDFNNDLTIGVYGILEPKANQCTRAKKEILDIVLVPGTVFSKQGDRLGYGAGYYDRFLSELPDRVLKIALAYHLQIVDSVPTDEYDVRMDMIITENGIIHCKDHL